MFYLFLLRNITTVSFCYIWVCRLKTFSHVEVKKMWSAMSLLLNEACSTKFLLTVFTLWLQLSVKLVCLYFMWVLLNISHFRQFSEKRGFIFPLLYLSSLKNFYRSLACNQELGQFISSHDFLQKNGVSSIAINANLKMDQAADCCVEG